MIIPFKKLSTLIGMVSTTLSTKTMQSSAVSLKNASVEMLSSGSRFRPIFWFTCVDDFVTRHCQGSIRWDSPDHRRKSSGILYPWNRCWSAIVVSEQENSTKIHELLVVVFVKHISVCCSSVTLDLDPIEYP